MQDSEDFSKQFGANGTLSLLPGTLFLRINSYLTSDRTMDDSKALFDYWHNRVRLRNPEVIAAPGHVQTQLLRHECTNYDELWRSPSVQQLDEPERSRVIAIIKYECTAQVLQNRAGRLRDRAYVLEEACYERDQQKSKLLSLIKTLQEKLFGKDKEIKRLETRIASLKDENEALRVEAENGKAEAELRTELEQLRRRYAVVEKRKQELAQNNQSLGGRVAHTKRYKQQRDEAKALVEQQQNQLATLAQENQQLRAENERLYQELKRTQN
jgi:regulator of replication initiation timing